MSPAGGGCRPDAARWFAAQSGTKGKTAEANLLIGRVNAGRALKKCVTVTSQFCGVEC